MIKRFLIALIIIGLLVGGLAYFQLVFKPKMIKEFLSSQGVPVATITAEAAKIRGMGRAAAGHRHPHRLAGCRGRLAGVRHRHRSRIRKRARCAGRLEARAARHIRRAGRPCQRRGDPEGSQYHSNARWTYCPRRSPRRPTSIRRAPSATTAEAALNRIKALIAQKSILAPFAGRLGIRHVELGQYISPGLAMVSLQALDPIWVDFPMPEQNVGKLQRGRVDRADGRYAIPARYSPAPSHHSMRAFRRRRERCLPAARLPIRSARYCRACSPMSPCWPARRRKS